MPQSDHDSLVLRLPAALAAALDRYREEHAIGDGREQAVLAVLREWALDRGYMSEAGEEGIRPEDLTAANDG